MIILEKGLVISLQILCIYALFQEGMILGWLRIWAANHFDKLGGKTSRYIQKPLWDCFVCMSSFWTIVLTFSFDLKLIMVVCGINTLLDKYMDYE